MLIATISPARTIPPPTEKPITIRRFHNGIFFVVPRGPSVDDIMNTSRVRRVSRSRILDLGKRHCQAMNEEAVFQLRSSWKRVARTFCSLECMRPQSAVHGRRSVTQKVKSPARPQPHSVRALRLRHRSILALLSFADRADQLGHRRPQSPRYQNKPAGLRPSPEGN